MHHRILIIRPGARGDFVLSLPVVAGLREQCPHARIEVLARGGVASLADGIAHKTGNLDTFVVAGAGGSFQYLDSFDLIITWSASPSSPYVTEGFGGEAVVLPATPVSGVAASLFFFERVPQLRGVEWRPARVCIAAAEAAEADRLLANIGLDPARGALAVHPGSGARHKCWPAEHFARVIDSLLNAGRQVLMLQGEADAQAVTETMRLLAPDRLPVLRHLPLRILAAVLHRCGHYLGNDSGVSHLAAAAGADCTVVFGPTDPAVWSPAGPNVTVVVSSVPCRPCGKTHPDCDTLECLTKLAPERVLEVNRSTTTISLRKPKSF
ncbi:MAG: glycosyltransferase family 9 protein [Planctomycetes bacterium]|nr:glycosyltransferase family 9 protein [Planctomycetota bacterium]